MPNSNSQIDGLGSFNQSAQNAGTVKYGAFLNASKNLGTIALSATFGNTSMNLGTIGDVIPIVTASIVQQSSANWDAAYTAVVSNSAMWALSGDGTSNIDMSSLTGVLKHVSEDTSPSLGGDLDLNGHHIYGGNYSGNQIHLPVGFGVYVKSLYEGAVNVQVGLDGTAQKSWVFDKDGVLTLPVNGKITTTNGNSDEWNSSYSIMSAHSAAWMLTDTTNSPEWDATTSFIRSNSGSLVYTNDSRLADTPNGNAALTYIRSNSADFVFDNDSRLSNARTPVSHNHDASSITSGKLDVDRLPIFPSQEQVIISGVMYTSASQYFGGDDHFTSLLESINQGTIVTTTDGYRWVYAGTANKRYNTSYVLLADITPEWNAIANKPASFPVDAHTQEISSVVNLQSTLNSLQSDVDGKQASGNYALDTDARFTVLAANSAQWGDGTVQGYSAYTYVHQNSASLVLTNDSRLSDSRTPLSHTHGISEVTGLQSSLDGKASTDSVNTKASLSAFDELNTLVQENSGTWEGVGVVYNYFRTTSATAVYSDDIRLAKADTAYSYLTGASASIVTTSILNSAIADKVDNSVLTNYVLTSDSRLSEAENAYNYVTSNSASIVMTSDSRLSNATTAYTSIQSNSAAWTVGTVGSINYTIDGGGTAIENGRKGLVQVPSNFIIQQWDIIADLQTTSFIVDVRKATYNDLPTTTSIVGSDFLTLTNQQKNRNSSVSWENLSAGDFVEFYVTDSSNASMINISLKGIRS